MVPIPMQSPELRIWSWVAAFWMLLCPVAVAAQDYERLRTATLVGSDRLRMRAFGDALQGGAASPGSQASCGAR